MKTGRSLRTRLVLLTTLAVAVVWLVTAAFTWRTALHEIEELLNHPPTTASHMQEERAELAGEIAKHLLMPMAIALPGLALVLLIAVGFSLRPLQRLAADVGNRAADRLSPNERRFTADASHELRTPLAALKAQAQVALAATDEAKRRHALNQIVAGSDRATHLLTQLLTLARLDADSGQAMQELDLRPLAEEVLAIAAGEAIAGNCELALAEGDARVRGNSALLQSLLRNLIDNALRHGGARQIEIAIARANGDVLLTVSDDGRGIPAAERDLVTQRFRRGTSADSSEAVTEGAPGIGLGLSIVSRIVELHAGRMQLDDGNGGHGLTVRIRLPGVN